MSKDKDTYLDKGKQPGTYFYNRRKCTPDNTKNCVTEINYSSELLPNYEKYKPNVQLPELSTFIEKIHHLQKAFLKVITNYTLDFNLDYLLFEIFTEMETMKGGEPLITYPETHSDSTPIIGNKYNPTIQPNVLIVGGGPVGLYMGIVLKLFNPELIVHVLETRVQYDYWKGDYIRKLNRPGSFQLRLNVNDGEFSKINDIDTAFNKNLTKNNLIKDNNLYIIPEIIIDKIKENAFSPSTNRYEAKIVESILARYAQSIGVSILHSIQSFDKYVNSDTTMIFDATGGRLFKDEEKFYVDPNVQTISNEDIGDGMNMNYLKVKQINGTNKLVVSIGDSLFKNNYLNGSGIFISFTLCLIIAGYLFPLAQTPKKIIESIKKKNIEEIQTLLNGANLDTTEYKEALDAAKELPESEQTTQIIELISATRFKPFIEKLKSKVQTRKNESKGGKRKKSNKQKPRKRRDRKTKKIIYL
jgi:hypothetical protein